ncbi:MAG: tRNA (adenosine(37)-N6)-threonylcarbamoyltransferase complex dimerization subunit type 1 TsaB, partial [Pirellulaceae bacterium]|nr:tRNA (adenosine(37)-N6)-threonylcarbamoyltransferase complex dimerization subunit type 1 TsaB [Pirellulaceae bacterium]
LVNQVIQLALETSIRDFSICLQIDQLIFENPCETPDGRASASLLPQIDALLQQANLRPADVGAVSISLGPGSFTGLRMGVATAKTLAWALNCPIYPVSSHAVIAWQAAKKLANEEACGIRQIAAVIDAQRGQWFSQLFTLDKRGNITPERPFLIVEPQAFLNELKDSTWVSGPGLHRWQQKLQLKPTIQFTEPGLWNPSATAVAELVGQANYNTPPVDPMELVPVYGRKSAAEEKLLAGELK